ncbi:hypothetical protein [Rhodococcus yananensis]|uniref:hypothetical protein n=1 Tax=Rhodococcus yananensis TaxID=2879464 RepID=UPI003EB7799F
MSRRPNSRTVWKLLGLAGIVGVAATGAVVARNERARRAYSPEEVRAVLHDRYARAAAGHDGDVEVPLEVVPANLRSRIRQLLTRLRRR